MSNLNLTAQLSTKLVDFFYQYDKGKVTGTVGMDVAVNWASLADFIESLDIKLHDVNGFQTRFKNIVQSNGTEIFKPTITVAHLISLLERDVDSDGNSSLEILQEKLDETMYQQTNSSPSEVGLPIRSSSTYVELSRVIQGTRLGEELNLPSRKPMIKWTPLSRRLSQSKKNYL